MGIRRRDHIALIVVVCATALFARPAFAQFAQQGPKLAASDAASISAQGFSVAISSDGNTAIVGAPLDNDFGGAAWIWTRSNAGVWTQQATKLIGSGSAAFVQQGRSVALSADGNTAAVGGPLVDGGAVWIWTRSAGVWSQQGTKLVGTGATGSAGQGSSVALSADGDTLVVGGPGDNSGAGAVWVWTRSGGVWTQQGGKLVGTGATGSAGQGNVALSADGNTLIVGGTGDNSNAGAVWIWTRSGGIWSQQGAKLTGSDRVGDAFQGRGVDLAADGNTAIVGGRDGTSGGVAWVWTRSAGTWIQQGPKLAGSDAASPASNNTSVSLSADGNTAIVGGPDDNGSRGAVWVWRRSSGTWTQQGSKLIGSGASGNGNASQGGAVALSGDGTTAIVGGPTDTQPAGTAGAAWIFVSLPPPVVTAHPASQTVAPGATATFTAAATGTPTPTVQWQVSTNGGGSFSDIAGATSATYSFTAATADNGKRYRAVFANVSASATTNAATLSVSPPTMSLSRTSLRFSAVTTGSSFSSGTPPQTVRLSQTGSGSVTWTAASNVPWLVVSPASGTGSATLTVATQFAPGLAVSQTGQITLTFTGAGNTASPIISVTLTTVPSSDPASPPFGSFDTPTGGAILAGSVAVTGWTLDNLGVQRVELWRDLQPGETTTPFSSTPSDPRHGKVFLADATFVDGARPDIEGLYPSTPLNYRGGWGYLMLTWGLWNQGNGTYRLYAFAFDQENNVATIGTKTIVVNNNAAFKPFGSIDTPAVGGDASGPNFGWALTPKVNGVATCKIQSNGVQFSIDSGPLQPVIYGDSRADIATAFTGYSNSAAAGGHNVFDWTTLTNGVHTIGWLVTDDCNRADGIGSRFFNVTNGVSALTAAPALLLDPVVSAFRRNHELDSVPVLVSRGYGELPEILTPDDAGSRTVEIKQGERIEMRLPRGFASAHQLVNDGQPRALPIGSTWDASSGIFSWEPAPGFLGRYRLVFSNGPERISVRVVVTP
jgi:hypothetical protein